MCHLKIYGEMTRECLEGFDQEVSNQNFHYHYHSSGCCAVFANAHSSYNNTFSHDQETTVVVLRAANPQEATECQKELATAHTCSCSPSYAHHLPHPINLSRLLSNALQTIEHEYEFTASFQPGKLLISLSGLLIKMPTAEHVLSL